MPRKNNQIRIISGKLGGRLIDTPKTDKTHPMGDRERAAIFNRLRGEIAGKDVLDAFAGSGAIGLEALSLEAASVDFLENNRKAAKTIHVKFSANMTLSSPILHMTIRNMPILRKY